MNAPAEPWIDDEAEPPPAWLVLRLAAELGDGELIEIEQDDG